MTAPATEPDLLFCQIRDADGETHLECRFADGQKFAAVTLTPNTAAETIAAELVSRLNNQSTLPLPRTTAQTALEGDLPEWRVMASAPDGTPVQILIDFDFPRLANQIAEIVTEIDHLLPQAQSTAS